MSGFLLRLATLSDLPEIMALEGEGFERGWSGESWAEEVRDHFVAVGCEGETVVGVVALSRVEDTAELLRIVVAGSARGRGLGRALVNHGLRWAESSACEEVFLEVSAGNEAAIGLYEACGFVLLDRRRDYYGVGDDALVYRWSRAGVRTCIEEEKCLDR